MSDLTFYIVQPCQGNIFFNKKHCLVYGKLLKQLLKDGVIAKILYYKQPSFKHKVYYQKYVDELFDEHISDNKFEDEKIKKNIANINIGLLEKGSNKASRNKMFDNLTEAMAFQKNWGGKLYVIDDDGQEYKWVRTCFGIFFLFLGGIFFFLVCGLCACFLSSSRGVVGWCFCGGVVVFLWWRLCGDVFVVVWLGGVFVVVW